MEFKLKEKEVALLKKWGYLDEDIPQIEKVVEYAEFTTDTDKKIDWLQAKRILGTAEFLSGLSRAAFHWDALRCNKRNIHVYIDCSNFFK